ETTDSDKPVYMDAGTPVEIMDCGGQSLVDVVEAGALVNPNDPDSGPPCWDFFYRQDPSCCGPQLVEVHGCGESPDAAFACNVSVTDPCVRDFDAAVAACNTWCAVLAPGLTGIGYPQSADAGPPYVGYCFDTGTLCNFGRPPRSFRPRRVPCSNPTGQALSVAAQLEAASVPAFESLATDLVRFRAPRRLVAAARRAARDEVRHARAMARAARRYGSRSSRVHVDVPRSTSLLELALRNAEEGCVRETFSAAVAVVQGRTATDPALRRTMRRIARDEIRHAALSWRLHEWLLSQLPRSERSRLAAVRRRTLDAIDAEIARAPRADPVLGMPGPLELRALLGEMREHLA
ncbi:MAG TPA: ferritin-like domain-containing protein, partial [Polyangiaceae bacterium]